MMRARRWALALVITLTLIDAWMPEGTAATRPGPAHGPSAHAMTSRP